MTQALSSREMSSESWREVVRSMEGEERKQLQALLTPKWSKYIKQKPYPQQTAFLLLPQIEALYGGAAGGGKSSALLMGALQYVDVPGYSALILRRTFADLAKPGAIMDRAREWLAGTDARWNEQKHQFRFPSGAVLSFGHLESENDKYAYQGAEYQYIGFDELTHFTITMYTYLRSRLRRLLNVNVPLRVRCGSNPGGVGHEWVYSRFFTHANQPGKPRRIFIPASLDDNLYLDKATYEESLGELDPVTYRQLRHGDWTAMVAGEYFKRTDFQIVDHMPHGIRWIRYWDLAATEERKRKSPDWAAGVLIGEHQGNYYVKHVRRGRWGPNHTEDEIRMQAQLDGIEVPIHIEQEPGASSKLLLANWQKGALKGYAVHGHAQHKDKITRAKPASAAASQRRVYLQRGEWNEAFLAELEAFPFGAHNDHVDGFSGGFNQIHVVGRGGHGQPKMPAPLVFTGVGSGEM